MPISNTPTILAAHVKTIPCKLLLAGVMNKDLNALAAMEVYSGTIVALSTDGTEFLPYDGAGGLTPFGAFFGYSFPATPPPAPSTTSGVQLSACNGEYALRVTNPVGAPVPGYVGTPKTPYVLGAPLYAGCAAYGTVGQWSPDVPVVAVDVPAQPAIAATATTPPVAAVPASITYTPVSNPVVCGSITHVPTPGDPWLGVLTNFPVPTA